MWLVRFWQIGNVLTTVGGALLLGSHVLVFWAYFISACVRHWMLTVVTPFHYLVPSLSVLEHKCQSVHVKSPTSIASSSLHYNLPSTWSLNDVCFVTPCMGVDRHDFHHSHNKGCYGTFTVFWDWAMVSTSTRNHYYLYLVEGYLRTASANVT